MYAGWRIQASTPQSLSLLALCFHSRLLPLHPRLRLSDEFTLFIWTLLISPVAHWVSVLTNLRFHPSTVTTTTSTPVPLVSPLILYTLSYPLICPLLFFISTSSSALHHRSSCRTCLACARVRTTTQAQEHLTIRPTAMFHGGVRRHPYVVPCSYMPAHQS